MKTTSDALMELVEICEASNGFSRADVKFIQGVLDDKSKDDESKARALLDGLPEKFTSSEIAGQVATQKGPEGVIEFIEALS